MLDVRNERQRHQHCTQVKTQTLKWTNDKIKTNHLLTQGHSNQEQTLQESQSAHMQEGAGCVGHHDGSESPEFECALKHIYRMKASA